MKDLSPSLAELGLDEGTAVKLVEVPEKSKLALGAAIAEFRKLTPVEQERIRQGWGTVP